MIDPSLYIWGFLLQTVAKISGEPARSKVIVRTVFGNFFIYFDPIAQKSWLVNTGKFYNFLSVRA